MDKLITLTFTYQGKRYYVRGKTERAAIEKLAKKKMEVMQGKKKLEAGLSVNEWFKKYIDVYKTNASENTKSNYKTIYKMAIKPYIGALNLRDVKPMHCQLVFNGIQDKSFSYVHKCKILMEGLFKTAIANNLIYTSPMKEIVIPDAEAGQRRALTTEEREIFLLASSKLPRAGLFCRVIYYCGLRPSEVARLKGMDINMEKKTIHVRGTKTKASDRIVPIPNVFLDEIPDLKEDELMFSTASGRMIDRKRIESFWGQIKRQMELEYGNVPNKKGHVEQKFVADDLTMYCLRHDYCTRLQEKGIEIDVARRLMGHSSVEITSKIYTHYSEITMSDTFKKINSVALDVAPQPSNP